MTKRLVVTTALEKICEDGESVYFHGDISISD
jgi:hypothetical protein